MANNTEGSTVLVLNATYQVVKIQIQFLYQLAEY